MGELGPEGAHRLRPGLRFKSSTVKECIHAILKEKLADAHYVPEEVPQLTKSLSEIIKDRLKEEGFDRYKMVVQVVIGEQRGEGVNMAARCFWDADTDSYAHDVFVNSISQVKFSVKGFRLSAVKGIRLRGFQEGGCPFRELQDSLFCVVAAFGCFYY
ncbi:dynein light chain Tctex-type protein 2B isoform X1 [Cygnus atratus]|uniref:dynein light chain Tctex-type protein 2B isoform X1 n=1 Tax=Cygnus atratus TaxID=8868 RepID=UPI0015D62149|nr:dynein light chain Tctex-type protein 2B isoform X1 [Cygnus atratus]XP_035400967.1 dynein light chain Tctex-type protein 2B isoform X1 [Cygnus atratus]